MRNTIFVEDCEILEHQEFAGEQFILVLKSEKIAKNTKAGQFVHIRCSDELLMRRPISIMKVDIKKGTFDLLYKKLGLGTEKLSQRKVGELLNVMGPIGKGFELHKTHKIPLLIGGGVGMPPMIAIAQKIKNSDYNPFVILGSEVPFPFIPTISKIGSSYKKASHSMPLLESWNIACRLASNQGYDGVFKGFVTDLAREYLNSLSKEDLAQVEIFSCGPDAMLKAVYEVAKEYNLPCQISLEEHMACAVGGCAGCVVEVKTKNSIEMKKVCVDGPVFNAFDVYS
ncbi:Dihydroorotate dehydrogenase electron transfer subunit [hydrothermal vent metagenome]|uniref:Dihydroorotate dehydrogenase electron transfer subunit n=1 Tax=hydrothermal vent metagenome TaxID=652676 RepID=A0A1W1CNF1_9ZZZZ